MKPTRHIFLRLSAFAFCLLGGCGGGEPVHIPVTGQVKVNGQACSGVTVMFWDANSTQSYQGRYGLGQTDREGKFSLKSSSDKEGIAAGTYKVTFSKQVMADGKPLPPGGKASEVRGQVRELFPGKYVSPDSTPEEVVVSASSQQFVFKIKVAKK